MVNLTQEENLLVRLSINDYIKRLQGIRNTTENREAADGLDYDIELLKDILFRFRVSAKEALLNSSRLVTRQ